MAVSMGDAALELVKKHQLAVLPLHSIKRLPRGFVCTCGKLSCGVNSGKHPLGALVPNGLRQATTDERTVRHWWHCVDYCNIGVATGDIVVLDVDPRHDGDHSLKSLEDRHGPLPPTWRVITGGNGEHVYFQATAALRNSAGSLGPGLDLRARGGYVVAPPSLHLSGRRHCWNVDYHPDDVPLAPMPDWLVALIKQSGSAQTSATDWRNLVVEGVSDGQRNSSMAKLAGHLLRRYVDPHVVLELLLAWNAGHCRPPLGGASTSCRSSTNPRRRINTLNTAAGRMAADPALDDRRMPRLAKGRSPPAAGRDRGYRGIFQRAGSRPPVGRGVLRDRAGLYRYISQSVQGLEGIRDRQRREAGDQDVVDPDAH
jgi:hypothetical protein